MRKLFWRATCALVLLVLSIVSGNIVHAKKLNTNLVKLNANLAKPAAPAISLFEKYVDEIYNTAQLAQTGLNEDVFKKAMTGFINLKIANILPQASSIITVVDFDKPSREKRMWVVDLLSKELLIHTWVAHGSGSGTEMASYFSNTDDSHESSLGFYVTDNIYVGKHGRSLRLDGLDEGFNDLARAREIVVHAAPYVSQRVINKTGRIGCSWGCPAVSPKIASKVINTIKGKTMLFINASNSDYTSKYLNEDNISADYLPSYIMNANRS